MSARPSLIRSIPFWILIVGSLAAIGFGFWLTTDKLGVMSATLTDGTATGLEVYVGQVWAVVGGILVATGLIGLALSLVLGVVRSLLPQPAIEVVETIAWANDSDEEIVAEQPAVVIDEPLTSEPAATSEPLTSEPASAPQR